MVIVFGILEDHMHGFLPVSKNYVIPEKIRKIEDMERSMFR
jgi:hypothetical protein